MRNDLGHLVPWAAGKAGRRHLGLNKSGAQFCGVSWSISLQKSAHHLAGRLLLSLLVGTIAGALPVVFSAEAVSGFRFSASQAEEAPRQAQTAPPSPSKQAQAPSEGAQSKHRQLKWLRSYARAVAVAKKQNKLIIADLYTNWCFWCVVMDEQTFHDPLVVERMGERYVWLRLNTETEEDGSILAGQFRVLSYPTTVVFEPAEELFEKISGFRLPADFQEAVSQADRRLRALMELRDRVRTNPGDSSLKFDLAHKYLARREYGHAEKYYRALINDGTVDQLDECYFSLALCLASQWKEAEAAPYLAQLRERFPHSKIIPDAQAMEGQLYFKLGQTEKAVQLWRQYLAQSPDHRLREYIQHLLANAERQ